MTEQFDVVVIGGGPGGATISTLVARAGHKVLLLEAQAFPRHQIGESLLPATIRGICPLLGVQDQIEAANFMPKKGGTFIWGKSKDPWTFYFEKPRKGLTPKPIAYQVERWKFDNILLENAKKSGVEVRHHCCVLDVIEENGRVVGVKYKDKDNGVHTVAAKYVADASGNRSILSPKVGERLYSKFFNNIAIYGYFDNAKRLPEPNQGNILVEAIPKGWIWYIPLTKTLTSVGVVVDKTTVTDVQKNKETIFKNILNSSAVVSEYLSMGTPCVSDLYNEIRVRVDYSYTNTKLWKPGLVLIGDAACFIDPIFSSGVHLATYSALLAARSINTFLQGTLPELECFTEFEERYRKEFSNFYNFLIAFYDMEQSTEDYFWAARKVLNTTEKSNKAFIKLVSGFSTEGIPEAANPDEYFNVRAGIGEALQHNIKNEGAKNLNDDGASKMDISKFMEGLTREITSMQAHANNINLEQLQGSYCSLIPTDDSLYWQKEPEIVT